MAAEAPERVSSDRPCVPLQCNTLPVHGARSSGASAQELSLRRRHDQPC